MIVLAFDVDGTLDTSAGPVPFAFLLALHGAGMPVAVVSPSSAWPKGVHPALNFAEPDLGRTGNLLRVREAFPTARVLLYVSDNPMPDADLARAAGFLRIEAVEFVKGLRA